MNSRLPVLERARQRESGSERQEFGFVALLIQGSQAESRTDSASVEGTMNLEMREHFS